MLTKTVSSIENGTFVTLVMGYGRITVNDMQEFDKQRNLLYQKFKDLEIFNAYLGSKLSVGRFAMNIELNNTTRQILSDSPIAFSKYSEQYTKEECIKRKFNVGCD